MDYNVIVRRLQALIYAVRRGGTTKVLGIVLIVSIVAGEYLRREWKQPDGVVYVAYAAYGLAGICFVWLVVRLWKVAAIPPEPSEKVVSNAIKGLLPWGISDGELFARLGRGSELQFLLDCAQRDQIAITVVRGESGVGKTSLLQAGLQYTLKKENCVYWEARSNDAPAELLHAIRNQFPEIESLDAVPGESKRRWVLILDQFEQLRAGNPEHAPVFQLLKRIAQAPAPHWLSVVIGFRREYQAEWSDFELANGFRAEQVAVKPMTPPVAGDVIATLAGKAGFAVEQALVNNFLLSIAAESDGVSPLDVSIGLESLANFARQRTLDLVTMNDYQLAGGAEGLLLVFVQQKLDEIPEHLRAPLLNCIVLSLVDLATNQRVAEGATAATMASTGALRVEILKPGLDRLTHARVRLLESVPPDRYRLPHERLVPVLRRLTGTALASLDQARLLLEAEYARWRQTRSHRHLLGGTELNRVLRYRDQLLSGENARGRTQYLDACLGRRRALRLIWAGGATVVAGSAFAAYRHVDGLQQTRALASWGLPIELFTLQHDLDFLEVRSAVTDFRWLRSSRLRGFEALFVGSSLAGLEQLKGLTMLTLHLGSPSEFDRIKSRITSLAGLEQLKSLTTLTLDLSNSSITNLAGLEPLKGLTTLTLDLRDSSITNLAALEQLTGLTTLTLELGNSWVSSLAVLERLRGLTTLSLDYSDLFYIDSPKAISPPPVLEKLKGLTKLTLTLGLSRATSLAALEQLKGLTELTLDVGYSKITSLAVLEQLKGLTKLTLDFGGSEFISLPLEKLKGLTELALGLGYSKITSLAVLEQLKGLTELTLYLGGSKVTSLAPLAQLKGLTELTLGLRDSKITSLAVLAQLKGLTELTLYLGGSTITSLAVLEQLKGLTKLTLHLGGSTITSLEELKLLKGLTALELDLEYSSINSLAGLEQLTALTELRLLLRGSKVTSLEELTQLKNLTFASLWLPLSLVPSLKVSAKRVFVAGKVD